MKSNKQLWETCKVIYREMYNRADPKADFDNLMVTGETKKPDWFLNYYLDEKIQQKIIDEVCKLHKLNKIEARKVRNEVTLGSSPKGSK